jgi:outer membrane protein assembly factor BamD (BamD/ComL family)
MFCNHCGSYNPDNSAFCGGCGANLEKSVSSPSFKPVEGIPGSGAAQSPAGEYIPVGQDMPPSGGYPMSQGTPPPGGYPMGQGMPPINDAAQTGYGMSQGAPPPTYPPSDQYHPAEMFNMSQTAGIQQSPSSIDNYQTWQTYPPPYGAPEAPSTPPPVVREPWYRALPKPMPLWAFIGSIVAVILVFVVLLVTASDWAAGAVRVGIVAGILAVVIALVTVVRILLGMASKSNPKRVTQLVSAGLAILLLLVVSLVSLTQQSTIHSLQAHYWEGQQQWQSSINEYQLAGEGTPTSENIARVYNAWGEQINSQQHYDVALAKYNIVLTNYGSASVGVARAQSDTTTAYIAWGKQASQQQDYTSAVSHYDALLQLSYCTGTCQSQANGLDATAYYNLAESKLVAQNYADAVNDFKVVVTRFPNSPEAQKLHQDYAKALFGHGQQQLTSATCSDAVPTYQQLSTKFSDTPEGQQATAALKLPQAVKGHFTSQVPSASGITALVALMHSLYPNYPSTQFSTMFYSSPGTVIQSDGTFAFKPQPQGTYDLVWGTVNNATGAGLIRYLQDDGTVFAFAVGPLCPYNFGDISYSIPTV